MPLGLVKKGLNHQRLKALARRANRARGEERERFVEKLIQELPGLDPFEGFSRGAVWLAKLLARLKWFGADQFS